MSCKVDGPAHHYQSYVRSWIAAECKRIHREVISSSFEGQEPVQEEGVLIQRCALDLLVQLYLGFQFELLTTTKELALLGHRTKVNLLDFRLALSAQSVSLTSLKKFLLECKSLQPPIVFGQPTVDQNLTLPFYFTHKPIFSIDDYPIRPMYLEPHLPSFPSTHTWIQTMTIPQKPPNLSVIRIKTAEQKRMAEDNLNQLLSSIEGLVSHHDSKSLVPDDDNHQNTTETLQANDNLMSMKTSVKNEKITKQALLSIPDPSLTSSAINYSRRIKPLARNS